MCIIWLSIQSKSLFSPHFLSAFYSNTEKQRFILTLELYSVLHLQSKKTQCGAKCPAQLKRYKLKKKKRLQTSSYVPFLKHLINSMKVTREVVLLNLFS